MQRYFYDEMLTSEQFELPKEIYKHAIVVMRMRSGDKFELVTPDENVNVMELVTVEKNLAIAKKVDSFIQMTNLPVKTTIVCGLSKGDKADFIVQKATELGADEIIFFKGTYSVAKWDDKKRAKKLARLAKIALAAAEQSHRTTVPAISYCDKLENLKLASAQYGVVAYEEAAKTGETTNLAKLFEQLKKESATKPVALMAIFGPEGGLAPAEVQLLTQKGFVTAGLGSRILRAETAPLYLLSALSFALELR